MDNTEASISSTATRTWHDFLERMRQPSATEFVKTIKNFIVTFSNTDPNPEKDCESVQDFFLTMETAFKTHPLWAGRTEDELESAGEGLEKYIMTKLFPRVFASHPDDIDLDNQLYNKSALIQQFIKPEHLDICIQPNTSWVLAEQELRKINGYKAPRDKLACALSCCKVISRLLFNGEESPPGADDFLPVLIYITIKANPSQLHSNLVYIQRFRNRLRLVGEAAYVFTNMLSVESFILNMDAKALSMDETEFEKNMESAQFVVSRISGDDNENVENRRDQSENLLESKLKEVPSVSDLEGNGVTMVIKEENVSGRFRKFPYLYSEVRDLRVGDVEDLLNGYKQLVFKYACLAKGLGVPILPTGEADGSGNGLGVPAPPPETHIGGGNNVEGGGGVQPPPPPPPPPPETQIGHHHIGGEMVDEQEGGVGASISPVAGELVSQVEVNVEK